MPFSSGAFSLYTPGNPVVTGTTIASTWANNTLNDIATGLSTCVLKDGSQTITANIPFAGYRLTGIGNATARTDAAAAGQVQDQGFTWCGTAGGTANALTLTPTPAITAYAAGQEFTFKAGSSANSGATTVAISGLSTIAVQFNGAACVGGEIQANKWYRITLDSTSTCQVESISGSMQSGFGIFASGTRMLFQQTSAPTGWTKESSATYNDAALRIVTGTVGTGGADAFSTHFGTGKSTAGFTLTTAEIPSHSHTLSSPVVVTASGASILQGTINALGSISATDTTGSGGAHSHTLNNFNIKYADTIIASKD